MPTNNDSVDAATTAETTSSEGHFSDPKTVPHSQQELYREAVQSAIDGNFDANMAVDLINSFVAQQPFSQFLGTRFTDVGLGYVTLEIPLREDFTQHLGMVHGGVLSAAADMAVGFAGGTVLGPAVVTGTLTLNFARPARGDLLRAEAHVVSQGRRQAVSHATVTCIDSKGEETLVVIAQGTSHAK